MGRIESAFAAAEELPPAAKRRVRAWAAEQFPSPTLADLAKACRSAAAQDEQASPELVHAALDLANAVDGGPDE